QHQKFKFQHHHKAASSRTKRKKVSPTRKQNFGSKRACRCWVRRDWSYLQKPKS
ncbi:unnamed protein product, partial [Amoebophrya sp. A120]